MMWRLALTAALAALAVMASIMFWQSRTLRPDPLATSMPSRGRIGTPASDPASPASRGDAVMSMTSQDISDGKRLYSWFNCVGCHAHGGGGIGPALMDERWIYGADPRDIYISIVDGRPNGMPAFGHRLAESQVWQLVAYVRSMSGLTPRAVAPGRNDDMRMGKPENQAEPTTPVKRGAPDQP